jgi:hypothetical protein
MIEPKAMELITQILLTQVLCIPGFLACFVQQ